MDAMTKWLIHTTHLPKLDVLPKSLLQISLLLNGKCSIQVRPPTSSLCLLFCIYPSSMATITPILSLKNCSILEFYLFIVYPSSLKLLNRLYFKAEIKRRCDLYKGILLTKTQVLFFYCNLFV